MQRQPAPLIPEIMRCIYHVEFDLQEVAGRPAVFEFWMRACRMRRLECCSSMGVRGNEGSRSVLFNYLRDFYWSYFCRSLSWRHWSLQSRLRGGQRGGEQSCLCVSSHQHWLIEWVAWLKGRTAELAPFTLEALKCFVLVRARSRNSTGQLWASWSTGTDVSPGSLYLTEGRLLLLLRQAEPPDSWDMRRDFGRF